MREAFMLPLPSRLRDRIVDREVMKLQLREANLRALEARGRGDANLQPERSTGARKREP
jgi:hypothetical protein